MSRNVFGRIREVCKNQREEKFQWISDINIFYLFSGQWWSAPFFRCFGIEMDFRIGNEMGFNVCTLRAFGTDEIAASLRVTLKVIGMYATEEQMICSNRRFTKRGANWLLLEFIDCSAVSWTTPSYQRTFTFSMVRKDPPRPGNSPILLGGVEESILEIAYGISREKSTTSRDTQTENTDDTDARIDLPAQLDLEEKSTTSRETQTENTDDTDARIDLPAQLDMEDVPLLREHFKDLLLSGDDHDVIMNVKDKQFKAHKCVLRARSPVFEAMFRNKMKESADGTVTIDDCDPEVFGKFLRYVYTGKVDFESASHAVGLFYVGDKYDLPRLKQNCIAFLKISLSTTTISDVTTLAARHEEEELLKLAIVYFSKHIEEIMLTVEWQRFLASNPTEANEMCLKAVQCLKASCTSKK